MNLGRKITLAKQALASITRHDDMPFAARQEAVRDIRDFLDLELQEAKEREDARIARELADTPGA